MTLIFLTIARNLFHNIILITNIEFQNCVYIRHADGNKENLNKEIILLYDKNNNKNRHTDNRLGTYYRKLNKKVIENNIIIFYICWYKVYFLLYFVHVIRVLLKNFHKNNKANFGLYNLNYLVGER